MSLVLVSSYIAEQALGSRSDRKREGAKQMPTVKTTASTMKLAIGVGILATIFCLPVRAQTVSKLTLDQAGAQTVLQAAREAAQRRNAPSAVAVVDPAGDLLAFQRMDRVRPASADLAIEKAR